MEKVTMYTLSTCPWCRKTKKFFTDHNVPFEFTDYDLADEVTQSKINDEMDIAGADAFPFVIIGDKIIVGYQPDVYTRLLGLDK